MGKTTNGHTEVNSSKLALPLSEIDNRTVTNFWRYGSYTFDPLRYGRWTFWRGRWTFSAVHPCDGCRYMQNMLVDRLGDEFDQETVYEELRAICPRIQWAFKSLCYYIVHHDSDFISKSVMAL